MCAVHVCVYAVDINRVFSVHDIYVLICSIINTLIYIEYAVFITHYDLLRYIAFDLPYEMRHLCVLK